MLHLPAKLQVQGSQRFIQKKHLRIVDQGSCNGYPLLLASAHFGRHSLFKALKLHQLQHLVYPFSDLGFSHLLDLQTVTDVISHIHMREQGVILKDGVDVPLFRSVALHVPSFQKYFAIIRTLQTCDDTECGGLATAG